MPFAAEYQDDEPTRDEIDQTTGLLLLEFGASWCGHCQGLSPTIEELLGKHPQVRHLRIADGRGKPLGRSFRVKLWPTLVFLREGNVVVQLVRPTDEQVRGAFDRVAGSDDAGGADKRASAANSATPPLAND